MRMKEFGNAGNLLPGDPTEYCNRNVVIALRQVRVTNSLDGAGQPG